jgi:hypothetical protein
MPARREQQTPGIKIRYREAPVAGICARGHRILNPHPAKHIHKNQRASFICGVVCGCVHRWSSKESHTQHNLKETNSHEAFCNTNLYYRPHYGTINRLLNVRCLSAPAPLHSRVHFDLQDFSCIVPFSWGFIGGVFDWRPTPRTRLFKQKS